MVHAFDELAKAAGAAADRKFKRVVAAANASQHGSPAHNELDAARQALLSEPAKFNADAEAEGIV